MYFLYLNARYCKWRNNLLTNLMIRFTCGFILKNIESSFIRPSDWSFWSRRPELDSRSGDTKDLKKGFSAWCSAINNKCEIGKVTCFTAGYRHWEGIPLSSMENRRQVAADSITIKIISFFLGKEKHKKSKLEITF